VSAPFFLVWLFSLLPQDTGYLFLVG
jgi:hypothetical protein